MSLSDVQAVIDSAKSRGIDPLERFVRRRLPDASADQVQDATALALEIIESIPIFLARADQEARHRRIGPLVTPVLDHAKRYFLHPVDLIPEMTQGLPGLLDDTYLVLRVLENLDHGPERFLDWNLDHPLDFLRRLVGDDVARKLDARSLNAMQELSQDLRVFRDQATHPA